jgi:ABC-type Fe3+-hydroxamate transport system substrate-binding protein
LSALLARRRLLAGAAALPLALAGQPAKAAALRVATVDWAILETLLAMGVVPAAAAELVLYRSIAVEPELPDGVADIGLRGQPNYEALRAVGPDLIFSSNYYAWAEPKLRLVAPVETISIYGTGRPVYAAAQYAARILGGHLHRTAAAQALVERVRQSIQTLKDSLGGGDGRPLIPINLGDARHFRVFGADSMFGEILARLGLANAWTRPTLFSASAPIGIEALAEVPDAWIVLIPPIPADAARILPNSAFWNALPSVKAGRVLKLEPIDPFGGLPAGLRFARLLAAAMTDPARGGGLG